MSLLKDLLRPTYRLAQRIVAAAQRPSLKRRIPALSSIDPAKPVYIFFTPAAITESHHAAHAIIARTVKDFGHQVLLVSCAGDYPQCLAMDIAGLDMNASAARRKEICRRCERTKFRTGASYGLPSIEISSLVSDRVKQDIRRQVMAMPADAGQFSVDEFRFGALCGSDLALLRKALNQMHVTGENRRVLEAYVEGALIAYRAAQKLIETYSVARIVYFNEYAMVLGAAVAAMKAGIPVTRLSQAVYRNIDNRKIALAAEPLAIYTYHRLLDEWPKWRDLSLSPALIEDITEHLLMRLSGGGHTVFSPRHGGSTDALYGRLGLAPDRHVLIAYTSSMDEYYSNINLMESLGRNVFPEDQPFCDQMVWLRELVTHVEASDDLQLVVRIHPREGRLAGGDMASDNLVNLKREFSHDFKHVRIVWPEETVSSYDLAEIADVALPGWSNISLELARMGVPTLTAFKRHVPFPLDDVVDWSQTPQGYFARIRELATTPGRLDQIRYAFHWTNVYSLSLCLNFDDLIPRPDFMTLPPYKKPSVAEQVEDIIVRGASVTEINRQALVKAQGPQSFAAEDAALGMAMRRMIWFLATGEIRPDDYSLALRSSPETTADLAVDIDGAIAHLRFADRKISRRSRIIGRLARLAANSPRVAARPKAEVS